MLFAQGSFKAALKTWSMINPSPQRRCKTFVHKDAQTKFEATKSLENVKNYGQDPRRDQLLAYLIIGILK